MCERSHYVTVKKVIFRSGFFSSFWQGTVLKSEFGVIARLMLGALAVVVVLCTMSRTSHQHPWHGVHAGAVWSVVDRESQMGELCTQS